MIHLRKGHGNACRKKGFYKTDDMWRVTCDACRKTIPMPVEKKEEK